MRVGDGGYRAGLSGYGKDKQLFGKLADFEKRIPAIKKEFFRETPKH
ncbi:MAG: hypothetical protein ACLUKN_04505 [Bacilli bacterium]